MFKNFEATTSRRERRPKRSSCSRNLEIREVFFSGRFFDFELVIAVLAISDSFGLLIFCSVRLD